MSVNIRNNADSPHTAITTWSGFIYQGKAAIYHVLHLLKDLEVCDGYILQLDSLDDFSILNEVGNVISLHQVKAKKSQYYSSYEVAIKKLRENADKKDCKNAKFHLAREISDKTSAEIASLHSPVEIYNYDRRGWCAVDEIDGKIDENIKYLLEIWFAGDASKQSSDYVRKARGYLDQIILKKVLEIHRIVHDSLMSDREAAYSQTILFNELVEILKKDLNQEDQGEDYYFYLLLNYFYRYYQEYCIEHEELTDDELIKLSFCMKEIGALSKTDMIRFICNIMPHREFKFNSLRDFKDNTFDKDEIHDAFLTILNNFQQPTLRPENYFYWYVEGKTFSPTTIDKGETQTGKVCERIIKNALNTDLDVMFEGCKLITTEINADSITDMVPEVTRNTDSDKREDDRISMWKKVSLVSLSNAKEVIIDKNNR